MSQQKFQSHRNSIKKIYDRKILSKIVNLAETLPDTEDGNLRFVDFQREILQRAFTGFKYDSSTIHFMESTPNQVFYNNSTICYGVSSQIADVYEKIATVDPLAPLVFANPGRIVTCSMVMSRSAFHKHPYFTEYLSKFGIIDGVVIGFLLPAHHNSYIVFGYSVFDNPDAWQQFDHTRLELASFPFFLAWLFRKRLIDLSELQRRLLLLEGRTENQIQNLRKFVNSPHQDFNEQALDLGIRSGTLKDDLYKTRKLLMSRVKDNEETAKEKNRVTLRELEHQCNFLTLLGDHTQPIVKPESNNYSLI